MEQSIINLNERRNRYQGGQGKLVTKGFSFCYDEEGNLAKKVEPNGDTWSYIYYGNGMLKEVTRPDRSNVRFKYDPFGRRIEKTVTPAYGDKISQEKQEKVFRFLWDRNTLFHEWEEIAMADSHVPEAKVGYKADYVLKLEKKEEEKAKKKAEKGERPRDNLITWVFQDDFIPRGKITKEGNYSIISDYLGTPVEAYDEIGEKVWERELDIYGRVKSGRKDIQGRTGREAGEENFIPFRFQGQYEDEETGLYYNRFRYYDPRSGQYTQQDPIGLAGNNPTLYAYVSNSNWWTDPFGLINFRNLTNSELIQKIWELAYRNKRLFNNSGTHGVVHRIREQITGQMRPPMSGWYTHDDQIKAGLNNLRDALNEARTRGLADAVNSQYPDVNKVSALDPPKPTDTKVPKICQ